MGGWEWTGTSRIPMVHRLCPCEDISASASLSNFVYIAEKGGTMKRKFALLILAGCLFVPQLEAQIKHIEMRVEGMT
jgi:hypothetical protein